MPFAVSADLVQLAKSFRKAGGQVLAAHLKGQKAYDEADYTVKTAILIGNESKGLSDALTNEASELVRIPMAGKVESLNAAMAASILMFEAMRQRRNSGYLTK